MFSHHCLRFVGEIKIPYLPEVNFMVLHLSKAIGTVIYGRGQLE